MALNCKRPLAGAAATHALSVVLGLSTFVISPTAPATEKYAAQAGVPCANAANIQRAMCG
jgi:hypothetical protein